MVAALLLVALAAVALLEQAASRAERCGADDDEGAAASPWRPGLIGGALVGLLAVALALVVPGLPGLSRPPASLGRGAPVVSSVLIDPVDAMAGLRDGEPQQPARTVLRVDTDSPSTGYLDLAVLDQYDGDVWGLNAVFRPTGGRIPGTSSGPDLSGLAGTGAVRQSDTIAAPLPLPLLPALDRPLQVAGTQVSADASTGMLRSAGRTPARFFHGRV